MHFQDEDIELNFPKNQSTSSLAENPAYTRWNFLLHHRLLTDTTARVFIALQETVPAKQ